MQFEPGAPAPAGCVPLCVPELRGSEWAYLKECLDTNFVSSVGPFVEKFERQISTTVGARFGVATASGTSALHIALLVAGVEPDDEVLVSTLSFIAPANAVRYAGAWPVFVDAEREYWQMDVGKAVEWLETRCRWVGKELHNNVTGRRVKAIIPVHVLGHPVDMAPLVQAAQRYDLAVIEDATESLGASYNGRPVGSLADVACLSFNGNKLITTGGGGMIVTDNEAMAVRAKYLTTQAKDNAVESVHGAVGFNYRMSNIQAALGCAQLEHLDEYLWSKRRISETYALALSALPGLTPMREAPWSRSACWMFTALVDAARFGMDSRALLRFLEGRGVQTRPLWQPLHCSPAHTGAPATDCSVAARLNKEALSLPSSVGLNAADQARVIDEIRSARVGTVSS